MKRPFLVTYDYGTGALWAYLWAESQTAIETAFSELEVVTELPAWMQGDSELKSYDVDGPLPEWITGSSA